VAPLITAAVCTRGRPESLGRTVRSLLACEHPAFEVLVVDQGDDDRSTASLQEFRGHPGLRHVRTATRGLAAARNLAMAEAAADLVAFTDDDCEVPCNWLDETERATADPGIVLLFGDVRPAACPDDGSFVPSHVAARPGLARSLREMPAVEGMGACMALRRIGWKALGGFDEMLGAGSPLRSAEELDFSMRALLAGRPVARSTRVRVLHHGLRRRGQVESVTWDYLFGTGAAFAKHAKCGHAALAGHLFRVALRWGRGRSPVAIGAEPRRALRLEAFTAGFLRGLAMPVDRRTGLFLR